MGRAARMGRISAPYAPQLAPISRLLPVAVLCKMAKTGISATFARFFDWTGLRADCSANANVTNGLTRLFQRLSARVCVTNISTLRRPRIRC